MNAEDCRLCLSPTMDTRHSILEDNIHNVLEQVFPFKIKVQDGLPQYVCRECVSILLDFKEYSELVLRVQEKLLQGSCIQSESSFNEVKELHNKEKMCIAHESEADALTDQDDVECSEVPIPVISLENDDSDMENVPTNEYPCDKCERVFITRKQLWEHRRTHRRTQCPVCKKMVIGRFLKIHIAAHEGAFQCSVCQKTFSSPRMQNEHMQAKHRSEEQQEKVDKYPCTQCERSFYTKQQLSQHKRGHVRKMCKICGKLGTQAFLKSHLAAHRGAYYRCELCEKRFRYPSNLRRHQNLKHNQYIDTVQPGEYPNRKKY